MVLQKKSLLLISNTIKKSKTFFIAGHMRPDGDTVGSALALASLLRRMGKKVEVYSRDPVPASLAFIPGISKITVTQKVNKEFDCAIILECLDVERMGNLISLEQATTIINIDHHANFNHYAHINYINPKACSSAELIYNLFRYLNSRITPFEAQCLYIGIVTDTGRFQQANTTPYALRIAAHLLEYGIEPSSMYDKLYANKSLSSLNLLGHTLKTLKLTKSCKTAYLEITRLMYKNARSNVMETEDIVNYPMMIPGVIVGVMFRETDTPGLTKISFRSRNKFDVNKVAQYFGGGGHKNAAGCSYKGTLKAAKKEVLNYLESSLKRFVNKK